MANVELEALSKSFGKVVAVDQIDLHIDDKELIVLVGPSGCGKTTTLRMIAGLESVSGGAIRIGGRVVNNVAPKDRDIAMVFQKYALYPHMNVHDNMAFGLKMRRTPKAEIRERIARAVEILGAIQDLLKRKPAELSGGQQQRVALGRAIVRDPAVFLFDEPLSNLDAKLRVRMRSELVKLHRRLEATMIYVTHDQVEAMMMGDRIVVMNEGRIQQVGPPLEVYNEPANRFVAEFIGSPPMNFFPGKLLVEENRPRLQLGSQSIPIPEERIGRYTELVGREAVLGLRPEDIHVDRQETPDQGWHRSPAEVIVSQPLGAETLLELSADGVEFLARVNAQAHWRAGEKIHVDFNLHKCHLFDGRSEVALGRSGASFSGA